MNSVRGVVRRLVVSSPLFHVANYRKYGVILPPLGWNNGGGQYKAAMVVYNRVTIKGGF